MSRVLAEIKLDAPIDTAPGAYARGPVDRDGVRALLAEYEMAATAAKLNLSGAAAPAEEMCIRDRHTRCPRPFWRHGSPPGRCGRKTLSLIHI